MFAAFRLFFDTLIPADLQNNSLCLSVSFAQSTPQMDPMMMALPFLPSLTVLIAPLADNTLAIALSLSSFCAFVNEFFFDFFAGRVGRAGGAVGGSVGSDIALASIVFAAALSWFAKVSSGRFPFDPNRGWCAVVTKAAGEARSGKTQVNIASR